MLNLFNRNNKTHRDHREDEFQILIGTNGLNYVFPKIIRLAKITREKIREIVASHSHACIWYTLKLNNKSKTNNTYSECQEDSFFPAFVNYLNIPIYSVLLFPLRTAFLTSSRQPEFITKTYDMQQIKTWPGTTSCHEEKLLRDT